MATSSIYQHKPIHNEQLLKRGKIAVLEQMKILKQAFVTNNGTPQTRGEVAMQEQMEIIRQSMTNNTVSREPSTRGEVAIQEQMRIFSSFKA